MAESARDAEFTAWEGRMEETLVRRVAAWRNRGYVRMMTAGTPEAYGSFVRLQRHYVPRKPGSDT